MTECVYKDCTKIMQNKYMVTSSKLAYLCAEHGLIMTRMRDEK